MSRTSSSASAGVQLASSSGSNVYTLLLIVATVALIATAVYLSMTLSERYQFSMPFTAEYDKAKALPKQTQEAIAADERVIEETLSNFATYTGGQASAGGAGSTP